MILYTSILTDHHLYLHEMVWSCLSAGISDFSGVSRCCQNNSHYSAA